MTSFRNAVIVNNEIYYTGVSASKNYNMMTPAAASDSLDYFSRSGRFAEKGEIDRQASRDDMSLELSKQGVSHEAVAQMLDYYGRTGRFASRTAQGMLDLDATYWDRRGVTTRELTEERILSSGSNVVRTVVTVSREWTEAFNMQTKEDWQTAIRANWDDYMARWNVMAPENRCWVAFYHTDARKSVHVHVLSWDKSGCFSGDKRIPKLDHKEAVKELRRALYGNFNMERSKEKHFIREAALTQTRLLIGQGASPEQLASLREKAEACGRTFAPSRPDDGRFADRLSRAIERIQEELPPDGVGRATYNKVSEDARAAANLAVLQLRQDDSMSQYFRRWLELGERSADILGLTGKEREAFVNKEVADLRTRIANVVLHYAARENRPWLRDKKLAVERDAIRSEILRKLDVGLLSHGFREGQTPSVARVKAEIYAFLDKNEIGRKTEAYVEKAIGAMRESSSRELNEQQLGRLRARIRSSVVSDVVRPVTEKAYLSAVNREGRDIEWATRSQVRQVRSFGQQQGSMVKSLFTQKEIAEMSGDLERVKGSIRSKTIDTARLDAVASKIISTPEMQGKLERLHQLEFGRDGEMSFGEFEAEKHADIKESIASELRREIDFEDEQALSSGLSALESIVRSAFQGRGDSHATDALEQRSGRHRVLHVNKEQEHGRDL